MKPDDVAVIEIGQDGCFVDELKRRKRERGEEGIKYHFVKDIGRSSISNITHILGSNGEQLDV